MTRKNLSQDEIDALFSSAAAGRRSVQTASKKVAPCDFGAASQLSPFHLRAVTALHESFVRRLATSLGAFLRVGSEMNLVAAEKLSFDEYLTPIGDLTYFASFRVLPIGASAALQVDLDLVYPIVDLVLGGRGESIELRGLTEVEEQIFETVVRLIVRDLQSTWVSVLEVNLKFEHGFHRAQVQGLMLPDEKVLALYFEIRLPGASGSLSLALPAAVANALLRKLSVNATHSEPLASLETQSHLRERLLGSEMVMDLSLPLSAVPVRDLIGLGPGRILTFPKRVHEPIHLSIGGKPVFLAFPVSNGTQRAARIVRRIPLASQQEGETK